MSTAKPIFREAHEVAAEITLPWQDRIRLIFGAKLRVNTLIASQWRGAIDTKTYVQIDKVFRAKSLEAVKAESAE